MIVPLTVTASDELFVDCGIGFVRASVPNRNGITTVECRRLWCRDLENGRLMGRDATPNNGYENTTGTVELYDGEGNYIHCFGRRRWCPGEITGTWDADLGSFTRAGASPGLWRSVLSGSCYRWQLQNHTCEPGQIAINNGTAWVCLEPTAGSDQGRAAVRTQTVRRSGVMAPGQLRR